MEILIQLLLSSIFLYINGKIIYSDFQKKIIPNKNLLQLLVLLPLWIYFIIGLPNISYIEILIQTSISLCITFALFYFQIWGAGDAKYLLLLSLFLPQQGIIAFVGNIAGVTLCMLVIYFSYFYFIKFTFNKDFQKGIIHDIKENSKKSNATSFYIEKIILFILIFTIFRICRWYIVTYINAGDGSELQKWGGVLYEILGPSYIIVIIVLISLLCLGLGRYAVKGIMKVSESYGYDVQKVRYGLMGISVLSLLCFIVYELFQNFQDTVHMLAIIFTIYLGIAICVQALKFLINVSFGVGEKYRVPLKDLQPSMVVDTTYIKKILGNKPVLTEDMGYDISTKILDRESIQQLSKVAKYVNKGIKISQKKEDPISHVIVIKTTPYAAYIFLGFGVTYYFQDSIIDFLLKSILHMVTM